MSSGSNLTEGLEIGKDTVLCFWWPQVPEHPAGKGSTTSQTRYMEAEQSTGSDLKVWRGRITTESSRLPPNISALVGSTSSKSKNQGKAELKARLQRISWQFYLGINKSFVCK